MKKSFLSVVVPAYNNEDYIEECLESICTQTYQKLQVIVIDDGSTDNTGDICDKMKDKYSFIEVFHKENEGVSIARNVGIDNAEGEFITFVDGDDKLAPGYAEKMVKMAVKQDADIVICDYASFRNHSHPRKSSFTQTGTEEDDYKSALILRTLYRTYSGEISNGVVSAGVTWGKLCRVDFLVKSGIRFIPGLVRAQDTVFWLNLLVKTDKISHLKKPLYYHRLNDQSVCGGSRYFADSRTSFGMLLDEYNQFLQTNKLDGDYVQAYYCRVIEVLFWHWKHNYFNKKNPSSFIMRISDFCHLMEEEPYRKALAEVDSKKLNRRQKGLVTSHRYHCAYLYVLMYRLFELLARR